MKFDLDQSTIQLAKGNLISLPDAAGSTIAVLWGSVWLTQDGHARDYELNAGDSLTIHGTGMTIVSAFDNAAITVLQACNDAATSTQTTQRDDRALGDGKSHQANGVHYLSADELEQFKRDALQLRDAYVASLIYAIGSALSRSLIKVADFAIDLWVKNIHRQWADPRNRLNLS
jgi:Protein of unknown function (DUF2917)